MISVQKKKKRKRKPLNQNNIAKFSVQTNAEHYQFGRRTYIITFLGTELTSISSHNSQGMRKPKSKIQISMGKRFSLLDDIFYSLSLITVKNALG